jgi:hypothetical protein
MHKRHLFNTAKLYAPMRRAEVVAFNSRLDMLLGINFLTARCYSPSGNTKLRFLNPGPDIVEEDGEYLLAEPSC